MLMIPISIRGALLVLDGESIDFFASKTHSKIHLEVHHKTIALNDGCKWPHGSNMRLEIVFSDLLLTFL